jgi:triosephosphate isomerase
MARRTLIAGNWKMNGLVTDGGALARAVGAGAAAAGDVELLVCPPATLVRFVAEALKGSAVAVGGQDCHADASGAHTGDTSAEMLADAGARYVIVGHSERRTDHGENDAAVRQAAAAGHSPQRSSASARRWSTRGPPDARVLDSTQSSVRRRDARQAGGGL